MSLGDELHSNDKDLDGQHCSLSLVYMVAPSSVTHAAQKIVTYSLLGQGSTTITSDCGIWLDQDNEVLRVHMICT